MSDLQFPDDRSMSDSARYPEASQSMIVLVLGIIGITLMPLMGPIAWFMGRSEIKAIDGGRRPPDGRRMARIGKILGMISTILIIVLPVLFYVLHYAGVVNMYPLFDSADFGAWN